MLIAHTYPNANSYTDRHANCDSDSDFDTNRDTNANDERNSYTQGFNYTETSSDSGAPAVTKLIGIADCRTLKRSAAGINRTPNLYALRKAPLSPFLCNTVQDFRKEWVNARK